MRVLVYTSLFPSRQAPIRGVYDLYVARELARRVEVRVICPIPWRQRLRTPSEFVRRVADRLDGVQVDYPTFVPLSRVVPRANPSLMELATRRTVERIEREFPFDVVFGIWGYPDAVAALRIARRSRRPLVTNLLGTDANELASRPVLGPLIGEALRASNSVLALSRAMAGRVAELGVTPERIKVQHNGVDHGEFYLRDRARARVELGLPLDRPMLLFTGNLVEVKGPDVLLKAFRRLSEFVSTKPLLVFVGAGSLSARLQHDIRRHGLNGDVRMVGRRPHDEIPVWMAAADVLCLPSRMEGCPNVVLEAFASGRPVVATCVGGVPELVEPARGILVAPEDPSGLSRALARALERDWHPSEIARSAEGFTWEAFGDSLVESLQSAVAEGPLG